MKVNVEKCNNKYGYIYVSILKEIRDPLGQVVTV